MKFEASNARAEAEASQEVNKALRRRIETLTSDVEELRTQLSKTTMEDRGLLSAEQSEMLRNDLLAERAKVRDLEHTLDQMKVSTVILAHFPPHYRL